MKEENRKKMNNLRRRKRKRKLLKGETKRVKKNLGLKQKSSKFKGGKGWEKEWFLSILLE